MTCAHHERRSTGAPGAAIALLALSAVLSPPALAGNDAQKEAASFGIDDFNGSGAGECDGHNLSHSAGIAEKFAGVFDDWIADGMWGQSELWTNKQVDGIDFTDASKAGSCSCESGQPGCNCSGRDATDPYGCDMADVCILSTHGGYNASSPQASRVSWTMGNWNSDCRVLSSQNMLWGNNDLEILIVDACNSARWQIIEYMVDDQTIGLFKMVDPDGTFSTFLGYHGTAPDRESHIKGFAQSSYSDGIGLNWLDDAYQNPLFGDDTCPVAVIFGDNADRRDSMYRYGGFNDRKDTGRKTGFTAHYICGCDPDGPKMPDC